MEVGSFWGRHEGTRCGARWGFRFGGSHLQRWTKTNENKGRHWTERIPLGEFPPTVASNSSTYCTASLGIVSFGLLQQVCRLQFFPPPWIAHRSYNIPHFHFPLLPNAVFHGALSGSRNFWQIKGRIRKLGRYGIFCRGLTSTFSFDSAELQVFDKRSFSKCISQTWSVVWSWHSFLCISRRERLRCVSLRKKYRII